MREKAYLLEQNTWMDAEKRLREDTVVVIALGAACKEHGPHLPLNNDFVMAEYLKNRIISEVSDIVVAPTIGFHFYPAFVEYPGSISLRLETARDLTVDVCASLAAFGPKKFYIVNTGISTIRPLEAARNELETKGIKLRYCRLDKLLECVKHLELQEGGTHADEVETSIMLHIAPAIVKMDKAAKDFHQGSGRLTREAGAGEGIYSPTGIWGDATLATKEKGRKFVAALFEGICAEIEQFKSE